MDSTAKPSRIGAYDIIDIIGRGGMGTVFRGNDPRIGRTVAIKMLTAAADDPDLLIRFYREAKYTGGLHHQNIVTVYELGHQDGVPYLVMEYLQGVTLEALISSGRDMPIAEKLGIILQVCNGLSYAHKSGLVHRDIKPANIIILNDGTAKIVDFGIALLGGSRLTRTGHVVGSLNYMSPEQLSGNVEVDVRTDVYSSGVVLFQLLTGVLPFDGGSTAATLRKIVQDPPPALSKYLNDCPPELEIILERALVKNREERYATADDFAFDLERVQQVYLKKMQAETLQQATDAMHRTDYTTARQLVLQVLKGSPQSTEASELLKQIKQSQEKQQHEQQVLQLQMKAEEAFRRNRLEEALQFAEHGIKLDPDGGVFPGLRDAIVEAQTRVAQYRETLKRADASMRGGDLDGASRLVEEARRLMPDDTTARALAAQIIVKLEQQLKEHEAAEKQREFALAVNSVEKSMADARMLLLLGQVDQALAAVEKLEMEVRALPPRWSEQLEALRKEILQKQEEPNHTATQEYVAPQATAEIPTGTPIGMNATTVVNPDAPREAQVPPPRITTSDVLIPRTPTREMEKAEVAPEMREFLQPQRTSGSRSTLWLVLAAVVLVVVVAWLVMRPKTESVTRPPVSAVTGYTYAEINAVPWATVVSVSPASGDAQTVAGQATPLRVKLPPGQYSVALQGPNREKKNLSCTVPQAGGVSCSVVFKKPDLGKIVGKE